MHYPGDVDQFDLIEGVDINHNGFEIVVHGIKNGEYHQYKAKYTSRGAGLAFANKMKGFIKNNRSNCYI